jgi:hypothetical protein
MLALVDVLLPKPVDHLIPNDRTSVSKGTNSGTDNVLFVATAHDSVYAFDVPRLLAG